MMAGAFAGIAVSIAGALPSSRVSDDNAQEHTVMYPVDLMKVRLMYSCQATPLTVADPNAGHQPFPRSHILWNIECIFHDSKSRGLSIFVAWHQQRGRWSWFVPGTAMSRAPALIQRQVLLMQCILQLMRS